MTVRIGANPICWSNDDMQELGDDILLETCLAEARSVGFEGMEMGHKFPRQAAALKAAMVPFGLSLVSGWYSSELLVRDATAELRALRPHLDLLKAMGCTALVLAETSNAIHGSMEMPLSQRPVMVAGGWKQFGDRMTEVAAATLAEGVRVAYHHHMGTVVQSEADIDAFMAATGPEVHLLLDTGHADLRRRRSGGAGAALSRPHRPRPHQGRARRDDGAEPCAWTGASSTASCEGVFTVPGDGMIDFAAVFRELPGYSGWVVLEAEQDPAKANPLVYTTKGYAHLRDMLAGAGLL